MRSIRLLTATVIVAGLTTATLTACGERNDIQEADRGASLVAVQRPYGAITSRFRSFESLPELTNAADVVVIGTVTDEQRSDPLSTAIGPFVSIRVDVEDVVSGNVPKTSILVQGEARTLEDGSFRSSKLAAGTTYLLYLSRHSDFDGYVVTGFMAGVWERVPAADSDGQRAFGRVDTESPGLPIGVGVDSSGVIHAIEG